MRLGQVAGARRRRQSDLHRRSRERSDPHGGIAGGDFLGLFQHMASAWADRYAAWAFPGWQLKDDALNGRTNAIVTIRMVSDGGWGPWGALGC